MSLILNRRDGFLMGFFFYSLLASKLDTSSIVDKLLLPVYPNVNCINYKSDFRSLSVKNVRPL